MLRGLTSLALAVTILRPGIADDQLPRVKTVRIPDAGIQPQLIRATDGVVHMIYCKGEAASGDVFYVSSNDAGETFSQPLRVNSHPGSAIAAGTIRGAQLTLGKNDRIHVAWNGSGKATPKGLANPDLPEDSPYRLSAPMLYTHMNNDGTGFESQRNLMTHTYALDGGGSVAADTMNNVYVVWHANSLKEELRGEEGRAVWVAVSRDGGKTFAPESRANQEQTGACGCCGLRTLADTDGNIYVLYRSARHTINRDMYALVSRDKAATFSATKLDKWEVANCVMSSAALYNTSQSMFAAWETEHQIKFARVDSLSPLSTPRTVSPEPNKETRKHPVLATNSQGQVILVWAEGTGWQQGGAVAWQVFDQRGNAIPGSAGRADGVPVWSFAAVYARPNGDFTIVY